MNDHMSSDEQYQFAQLFQRMAFKAHQEAAKRGFWIDENFGEKIALIHSELSECLEARRSGNLQDEHCPNFSSVEIELADTVIRILDLAGAFDLKVGSAIIEKLRFNTSRPFKHNKEF